MTESQNYTLRILSIGLNFEFLTCPFVFNRRSQKLSDDKGLKLYNALLVFLVGSSKLIKLGSS